MLSMPHMGANKRCTNFCMLVRKEALLSLFLLIVQLVGTERWLLQSLKAVHWQVQSDRRVLWADDCNAAACGTPGSAA